MFREIIVEVLHEGIPEKKVKRPFHKKDGTVLYEGQWYKVEAGRIEIGPKPAPAPMEFSNTRTSRLNMSALALQLMFGGFR